MLLPKRSSDVGRPVVLSNGQLFVGLDENGLVHDFYYPYVGLDNLTNARSSQHKIGVWIDGMFRWTDDGSWRCDIQFEPDALISAVVLSNDELGVTLHLQDTVDAEHNAFLRHITLSHNHEQAREVRLFMHQVFQISRAGRGDTAMYVPEPQYILDYKGRYCLLINGIHEDGSGFDEYAVGNYGIEGKAGTFKDAEDGELSGNSVEHGGVDSVFRFSQTIQPHSETWVDYWIVATSSQTDAEVVNAALLKQPPKERLRVLRQKWQTWSASEKPRLAHLDERRRLAVQHSALIIKAHCDERGSILASGDSSIFNYGRDYYCYCWPRDAAYALWPLLQLGHFDEAKSFFEFARDTMHTDGYMMHKYQPDRAIGSTWHPLLHGRRAELAIQEDETASVIFMLNEYQKVSNDDTFVLNFYHTFVQPGANFMCSYVDHETGLPHASYDLWEQTFQTSTYTVSTVIAGLRAAADLADLAAQPSDASKWRRTANEIAGNLDGLYHPDGYFRKGLLVQEDGNLTFDDSLDISSLYGPLVYGGLAADDPRVLSTLKHVEEQLLNTSPVGGVIRYPGDGYFLGKQQYPGNPWVVCTLWLAQVYQRCGRTDEADQLIEWALWRQLPSGAVSEQFDPEDGSPIGVTPLVWSQAEIIRTILAQQK
jgi:GH15 family glucan-1,4-alpha-glucosidase